MNESVDRFIAKAQTQSTPTSADGHPSPEDDHWDEYAPGVDPAAYIPKPLPPIPVNEPVSSLDTSKIPLGFPSSSTKSDIEDYFATPGVCGLLNLGNTCYMNAGLQCVFGVKRIAKFYISDNVPKPSIVAPTISSIKQQEDTDDHIKDSLNDSSLTMDDSSSGEKDVKRARTDNSDSSPKQEDSTKEPEQKKDNDEDVTEVCQGQVSASFSNLVRKLWTGHYKAVVPDNFKTVLGFIYSQFNGFRQQDCQEFLVVLLDRLNEELCYSKQIRSNADNPPTITTTTTSTDSIITDTFQGDLKNIVTCCRCGHVSTKTDPFMYLSVPIPHAHERQLEITWCPATRPPCRRKIVKHLVVIPKVSSVLHVKQALCESLEGEVSPDHITLAHVKNSSIELTLGDSLASSRIKDNDFLVYGFETDPQMPSPTIVTSQPSTGTTTGTETTAHSCTPSSPSEHGYAQLPNEEAMETNSDASTSMDPWTAQDKTMEVDRDEATPLISNQDASTTDNFESTPFTDLDPSRDNVTKTTQSEGEQNNNKKVVVMEWHSCGICLEEMVDSDLLTHPTCGAILCEECLQASKQHTMKEDGKMPCPVCQKLIIHSEDFVPLAKPEENNDEVVVRLLQVTVLFRQEDRDGNWSTFGHPALLNLPQNESIDYYYNTISYLLPTFLLDKAWHLALTDGKGRFCSRCLYGTQCRGCVLSNAMKDVSLKPGDHLTVTFRHLSEHDLQSLSSVVVHHASYENTRWPSTVTLNDCLQLFSQRERLGHDNPWWCPECESNQEAIRQLMVSRLPLTVIVHLKRFLFQDNAATKVDTSVVFPMTLSSSDLLSDVDTTTAQPLVEYNLTGCVCHFGTLNSGHYTSYSKHPVTDQWHYYNDETVTEKIPSEEDGVTGYILLYSSPQKENDTLLTDLPIERGVISHNPEEELTNMGPLLRLMKPKPAPLPPPPPPLMSLKRASSLGDVSDNSAKLGDVNDPLQGPTGLPLVSSMVSSLTSNSINSSTSKKFDGSTFKFKSYEI